MQSARPSRFDQWLGIEDASREPRTARGLFQNLADLNVCPVATCIVTVCDRSPVPCRRRCAGSRSSTAPERENDRHSRGRLFAPSPAPRGRDRRSSRRSRCAATWAEASADRAWALKQLPCLGVARADQQHGAQDEQATGPALHRQFPPCERLFRRVNDAYATSGDDEVSPRHVHYLRPVKRAAASLNVEKRLRRAIADLLAALIPPLPDGGIRRVPAVSSFCRAWFD